MSTPVRPEYDEDYNKEDDNSPDPVCPCGEVVGAFDNYQIDGQAVCQECYEKNIQEEEQHEADYWAAQEIDSYDRR